MKKLAAVLILACLATLYGCAAFNEATNLQEYEVQGESIPTINAVVGERKVTGVGSSSSGDKVSKEYTYESPTVNADLKEYLGTLVNEIGFIAIDEDIDLDTVPGTAKLAAESPSDPSKLFVVQIDYTKNGYKVTVSRMAGSLTYY